MVQADTSTWHSSSLNTLDVGLTVPVPWFPPAIDRSSLCVHSIAYDRASLRSVHQIS